MTGPDNPQATFSAPRRRDRLIAAAPEVLEVFAEHVDAVRAPGLAFGVIVDGECIYADGVGVRVPGGSELPNANTVYRIASMTKSFTAAACLKLRDEGRLRLDDRASSYIPELEAVSLPSADSAPITVRDLLSMVAGWPQDDPWADRQLYRSDQAFAELLAPGIRWSTPPGAGFEYSNLAYILLGTLIHNVSGIPATAFITERLLAPLGMTQTCWNESDVDARVLAPGQRFEDAVWKEEARLASGGDVAAFAGLFSTVSDLARWVALFLDAEPARDDAEAEPLGRASLREMMRIHAAQRPQRQLTRAGTKHPADTSGYGFGLQIRDNGRYRTVGHGGGLPGYGSHMRWLPDHGFGIVGLANVTYAAVGVACDHAIDVLLRAAAPPARRRHASADLLAAQDGINRLLVQWDAALVDTLFADNFLADLDAPHWLERIRNVKSTIGELEPGGAPITPHNWLRGEWRVNGSHGWCHVWITLSPLVPARVQYLRLTTHRFPRETLSEAAELWAGRIGTDELDAALAELPGPLARAEARADLAVAALELGPCKLGEYAAGDGNTSGRWQLAGSHGIGWLEISLGDNGELSSVRVLMR